MIVMGGSELDNLLNSFIDKKEHDKDLLNKQVRFSISLTNFTQKRLDIIAKQLELSKQEFISKVVEAALTDIEERLGYVSEPKPNAFGEMSREYDDKYAAEIMKEIGLGHFLSSSNSTEQGE